MATTVAQHSVATFTSPVNGTTPIDANTVRGNDNTTRAAYNDHDADPGIHVQSSTLASRPVAGTAGRKWITDDGGVYTLWFDDGTHWHPVSSENIALTVLAGENLVKGDVVKVTGWNNGQDLPEVVKTTSAADTAFAVITATVTSGSLGYATNTGIVQDVNTAAYSVGTILYANGSGGFTSTKPTSGNYQPVAYVLRANASNGVYYVEFSSPRIVERSDNTASTVVLRDSNGDFSAGTITATAVNATTLDLTNLEVTNIKAKDGTQAIAIADTTGKLTISDGVLLSGLTASQAVFTDGSKNLVSNAITGTGNVVMSASPTLTGTVTAATLNATTLGGTLSTAAQPNVTSVGTLSSLTVSGNVTVDTNTLFVNSSTNKVGIGTASPSAALHVNGPSGVTSFTGTTYLGALVGGATSTNDYSGIDFSDTGAVVKARIAAYFSGSGSYLQFGTSNSYGSGVTNTAMTIDFNGNLAVDTDTLYVDAANNRVGVGTASPVAKLQTTGTTNDRVVRFNGAGTNFNLDLRSFDGSVANAATYRLVLDFADGAGTNSFIDFYRGDAGSNGYLGFGTSGSTRALLDASGNLGLGVTPSAWAAGFRALQIGAGGGLFGLPGDQDNTGLLANAVFDTTDGRWEYIGTGFSTLYQQDAGAHAWYTAPSGTAGNAITFTQAMTLDAGKRLLVGYTTDTGDGSLQVDANVSGATVYTARFANSSTSTSTYNVVRFLQGASGSAVGVVGTGGSAVANGAFANAFHVGTQNATPLTFGTNDTERARITSGGYSKFSNDGTYGGVAGAYHEFRQTANGTTLYITSTNTGLTSNLLQIETSTAAGTGFNFARFFANGVAQCDIRGDGNLYNTNGTYGTISDAAIKQDIVDASSQWADLKAIQFRKYRLKDQVAQDANAPYLLGVVAQELEQVSPGLVDENRDGIKAVKQSILLMKAAVALQEAMARIETLEQRVLALEA